MSVSTPATTSRSTASHRLSGHDHRAKHQHERRTHSASHSRNSPEQRGDHWEQTRLEGVISVCCHQADVSMGHLLLAMFSRIAQCQTSFPTGLFFARIPSPPLTRVTSPSTLLVQSPWVDG